MVGYRGRPPFPAAAARGGRDPLIETIARGLPALGILPPITDWQPLAGGRVNSVWRVTGSGVDSVCKVYAQVVKQSPIVHLFANHPETEFTVLQRYKGGAYGLFPALIGLWQRGQRFALLYRYTPGHTWANRGPQAWAKVARALGRVHSLPRPAGHPVYPSGYRVLLRDADRFVRASGTGYQSIACCRPVDHTDHPTVGPWPVPCLIHRDVTPGNIICHGHRLTFIDWQCAGYGDPCEDLALFVSPTMHSVYGQHSITPDQQVRFLRGYPHQRVLKRYSMLAPYLHYRIAAYANWRVSQGNGIYAKGLRSEMETSRRTDWARTLFDQTGSVTDGGY